jgi:hypothetical protein
MRWFAFIYAGVAVATLNLNQLRAPLAKQALSPRQQSSPSPAKPSRFLNARTESE